LPVAAIILAAGSASRMGRLKQVLPYGEGTLVQHAVKQAIEAGFAPVIVVLGAESEEVRARLSELHVQTAENKDWQLGMGSSIARGMRALLEAAPKARAVAILLADQPLITAEHLCHMRERLPDSSAVAAEYAGSLGVPAIFQREMFSALLALAPEAGAKQILREAVGVVAFPLPEAAADIDTPDDYARLTS
jgi:molybdenum cofactor cytidylyltransferase